jgi:hypothetical protein
LLCSFSGSRGSLILCRWLGGGYVGGGGGLSSLAGGEGEDDREPDEDRFEVYDF